MEALPVTLNTDIEAAGSIVFTLTRLLHSHGDCGIDVPISKSIDTICAAFVEAAPDSAFSIHSLEFLTVLSDTSCLFSSFLQNEKALSKTAEALQSVLVSKTVPAEVQCCAILLISRMIKGRPLTARRVFQEQVSIVEWLLETVRNGKATVKPAAILCLRQHFVVDSVFANRHSKFGKLFQV